MRAANAAVLGLALLAPVAFAKRLRFDLDMPQPLVWDLAKKLSPYLSDGGRLALLLPGDNDSVATMISGVLADTPPRRRMLDLLRRNTADAATLDEAARLGYPLALISCTPNGLGDLPADQAVLLRHDPDGWHLIAAWPYPPHAAQQSMATHPVLASALPQPVVLRASSFWAPTGGIVEDREYLESRLPKERPQTPGGRDVRWLAPGHGDKVVLLERP